MVKDIKQKIFRLAAKPCMESGKKLDVPTVIVVDGVMSPINMRRRDSDEHARGVDG